MNDVEAPNPSEQDDLSIFEQALAGKLDYLPPVPSPEEPKSELEILRGVIDDLSEKFEINIELYDGRELGYQLALNHRVDDMCYTSPGKIEDELAISIQDNQVTEQEASNLYGLLTDPEELDLKDDQEVERHLVHVYRVLEAVVVDPYQEFVSDLEAKSRLTNSLQASATTIQRYIDDRPARNAELILAKDYLSREIGKTVQKINRNFRGEYKKIRNKLKKILGQIQERVDMVDESLLESRSHLVTIINGARSVATFDIKHNLKLIVNNQKIEDVLSVIADL